MIKLATIALSLSLVLWVGFYLPKRLRKVPGARLRYTVFAILAFTFAFVLLKRFL